MVRIPVEYQEVEYLESSGTQWINTGIPLNVIADEQTTWHLKFSPTNMQSTRILCGANVKLKQVVLISNGLIRKDWAVSGRTSFSKALLVGGIYLISQTDGLFKLQSTEEDAETEQITKVISSNYPFALFAKSMNIDGTAAENSTIAFMKLYSFKAFSDDSDICNFIPCYRKSDSEPGMYDTVSGTFFTNQGTGTFLVGNDVSWDTASLIERRRQILLNTPHLTTESANPLTFQTDISANLKDCKIYFEPVQEGSGDPSPDNVRPISGWDGVTVYKYGANLFPLHQPATAFRGQFSTGDTTISSASALKCWTIYVGKNKKLMYQRKTKGTSCQLAFCDTPLTSRTGAVIYNALNMTNRSNQYINSGEHPYLVMCATDASYRPGSSYDTNELMLSFGTTAKPYVPRTDPSSLTIPFPQTIYGGYVDIKDGEAKLVVNRQCVTKALSDAASSAVGEAVDGYFWDASKPFFDYSSTTASSYSNKISNILLYSYSGSSNITPHFYANVGGHVYAYVPHGTDATTEIQICVPLATPIEYTLDQVTLTTLKGINNIWSDANGNIEVKFWKH